MSKFFEVTKIDRNAVNYLIRNLEDLEKDEAVRRGLKDAGNVFKAGGQRRLKERMKTREGVTGNLNESINVRVKKRRPGVLIGFRQGKNGGNHAHLIDQGTNNRYTTGKKSVRAGIYRGRVTGNAFWTDTRSQDYPQAMDKLYEGIERAVSRITERR